MNLGAMPEALDPVVNSTGLYPKSNGNGQTGKNQ